MSQIPIYIDASSLNPVETSSSIKSSDKMTSSKEPWTERNKNSSKGWFWPMFFKTIKKYFNQRDYYKDELERMMRENVEFFQKLKELNEEKDMIKKLARNQEQEIVDMHKKVFATDELYKDMKAKFDLQQSGLEIAPDDIKAITLAPISNDETGAVTYAPVIFTLDKTGTVIKHREAKPDTQYKYALENLQITFIELFDKGFKPIKLESVK